DLERAVHDDADGVVGLVRRHQLDADDMLDRVARQRDDHQAGECLREMEDRYRWLQRGDEPFGDERRAQRREDEDGDREPDWPDALGGFYRLGWLAGQADWSPCQRDGDAGEEDD